MNRTPAPEPHRSLNDFAGIASDWFWETDANHRFSYFSQRMSEATRMDATAILGKDRTALPNEDLKTKKWRQHLADLSAHRPFHNFEYHVRRPTDGTVLWIRISGTPVFDDAGTFQGYRGVGHDITVEKQTITRLEASNATLEQRNKQLDEARLALERAVFEDFLTSAWNRRAFERDVNDMLSCTDRHVGLLHIDLDKFKWINDTLGHPVGDVVLQMAATRIRLATGALGSTYRVGGDEFMVILCDHVTQEMAMALGHQITNAMAAAMVIGQRKITVGASIGVVVSKAEDISAQRLISHADAALYEAKHRGRNAVCTITDEIQDRIETRRKIAADIPRGLELREFVPYFQPQFDLVRREVIGAEVLVRWQHPTRGLVPPHDFLTAASELAVIDQIDRQMLEAGLAAVNRLAQNGIFLPSLSINASQARLLDPRLLSDVGCLWTDQRCSLTFELLETICFDDNCDHHQLFQNLDRMRAMGVRLEMDDFGSGRASITGLLKVAPDRLKIDSRLVKEVVANPQKRSLVQAILDMAQALGIECMAEGAETDAALDILWDLGCTQVQGYAVAAPMSETAFAAYLQTRNIAGAPQRHETQKAGQNGLPQSA